MSGPIHPELRTCRHSSQTSQYVTPMSETGYQANQRFQGVCMALPNAVRPNGPLLRNTGIKISRFSLQRTRHGIDAHRLLACVVEIQVLPDDDGQRHRLISCRERRPIDTVVQFARGQGLAWTGEIEVRATV